MAFASTYSENGLSFNVSRAIRGGAGLLVSLGIHLILVLVLWLVRGPETIAPEPLSVSVLSEAAPDRSEPPPVDYQPAQQVPKLLQMEMPEIVVPEAPLSNAAPVAVSTSAPAAPATAQVVEPRFDVDYLNNPSPNYPKMSRRLREEGVVLLRVHVQPNGQPDVVELKRSSGSPRLDDSAMAAVRQWRFVPARRGNEAIAAWVVVPVAFSLT